MNDKEIIDPTPGAIISIKTRKYKCDTCGKKHDVFAMDFSISDELGYLPQKDIGEWVKGKHYRICYPCFMKKMGWK